MKKIAILTSHPIQYQGPLFQLLAKQLEIDLTVYFCWDFGIKKESLDVEFGKKLEWDIPLLDGYQYKFLKNYSFKPSSKFWGQVNPGIIKELILGTSDVHNINGNFGTSDVQLKKTNAILTYGWNSFSNWLAFLTAFLKKIPVFLHAENPLNQELLKPKWKIKIKKIVLGWLFKRISAFLYIGEENKKFYQYYGVPEDKLFFAPYAVDNKRFIEARKSLSKNRKLLRKELRIDEKDIVILFVGKLIYKKHPFDLLRAYELLNMGKSDLPNINVNVRRSDFQKFNLIFVGDGILRPELENYVKEYNLKNVHFTGFKNQTEIPKYYALSDILVLPSGAGETWGLVVNEAMCFGLPIIASDVVGCGPDLVKHSENGYIFPVGDIKALAKYLRDLIYGHSDSFVNSDKFVDSDYGLEKRKKFGKKSFEIIQNYSYEKDVNSILKALTYIYLY